MQISNIEVQVLVEGKPIKQYGHEGRTFVMAKDGVEYSVKIRNNNPHRVLAVVAVDGVDTMTGKAASQQDGGYVIAGYSAYTVTGYRKDMDSTAAFKFVPKQKSYAKAGGKGGNEGVIAVAVWGEKEKPREVIKIVKEKEYIYPYYPPWYPYQPYYPWRDWEWPYRPWRHGDITWTCQTGGTALGGSYIPTNYNAQASAMANSNVAQQNALLCSQQAQQGTFQAGTTWGQKVEDRVVNTEFERTLNPLAVFEIFYDYKAGLKKLGVNLEQEHEIAVPQGFPSGFAQPPNGWSG